MKSWGRHWDAITPIFKFSSDVRKAIYTTNAIESLSSTYRKQFHGTIIACVRCCFHVLVYLNGSVEVCKFEPLIIDCIYMFLHYVDQENIILFAQIRSIYTAHGACADDCYFHYATPPFHSTSQMMLQMQASP